LEKAKNGLGPKKTSEKVYQKERNYIRIHQPTTKHNWWWDRKTKHFDNLKAFG
jgi:hypothetical protein